MDSPQLTPYPTFRSAMLCYRIFLRPTGKKCHQGGYAGLYAKGLTFTR